MIELRQYQTKDGKMPVAEWLDHLRDGVTRARIIARLDSLAAGLYCDWKAEGGGVSEQRIDHGPGYRMYYAGDKSSQAKDIERAHAYWKDCKERCRS
jgi:putative addiction module killer protein